MKDKEAWCAALHGVTKSRTWLRGWTTTTIAVWRAEPASYLFTGKNGQGERHFMKKLLTVLTRRCCAANSGTGRNSWEGTHPTDSSSTLKKQPSSWRLSSCLSAPECQGLTSGPGIADPVPGNQNLSPVPVLGKRKGCRLALGSMLKHCPGWSPGITAYRGEGNGGRGVGVMGAPPTSWGVRALVSYTWSLPAWRPCQVSASKTLLRLLPCLS